MNIRQTCYKCYRPQSSCMCSYVNQIDTNTQFIILMHPKEYRKTKNGTGQLTHLSLKNSKIFVGIDFSNHKYINETINNKANNCYILYPHTDSIKLNTQSIKEKNKRDVIFIIDSTWPCSLKILRVSQNLQNLPKISFDTQKTSQFKIKTQPNSYCLSTIESTQCVLELLNKQNIENISQSQLSKFLYPFEKMVEYQVKIALDTNKESVRYKKPYKKG